MIAQNPLRVPFSSAAGKRVSTAFSGHLHSFLSKKNPLLPEEPEHSADLANSSNLLSGLNNLAQMREELVQITEDIIFQVRGLRPEETTPAPTWVN